MAFLKSLDISGSALSVQKTRMNVISQNIANTDTTRTENGGPYRRKITVIEENAGETFANALETATQNFSPEGAAVARIEDDQSELKPVYNPTHPDADANGYVLMPNVDTTTEMVDMIASSRSYEANVTAFNAMKLMASKALEIGK